MKKLILLIIPLIFLSGCTGKIYEGKINMYIEDCFQQIKVSENDSSTKFRDFTCEYERNSDNKIYKGECYSFEIKKGKCVKGYFYEVGPEFSCSIDSKMNDMGECECNNKDNAFINGKCVRDYCMDKDSNTKYDATYKECRCRYCNGRDENDKCLNESKCADWVKLMNDAIKLNNGSRSRW